MPFSLSSLSAAVKRAEDQVTTSTRAAHASVVSAVAKAPKDLPSKGIQVYTYIAAPPSTVRISLSVPGRATIVHSEQRVFHTESLEIEAAAIQFPRHRTGRFEFVVTADGAELTRQHVDIDPLTGSIADSSSMDDVLEETVSLVARNTIVCYGMYRAGPGCAGLPNRHQIYIVVTQNWSAWHGIIAPPGSPQADKPFNHLVLPAPHDPGMNTMATVMSLINSAGPAGAAAIVDVLPGFKAATPVLEALIGGLSTMTVAQIAPHIVASLAITQKDVIAHLCSIGARYFEFRPAHCHERLLPYLPFPDELFFQHGPIPGMAYADFLAAVVTFLQGHRDELVVVHVRWDGVPAQCRRPDSAELARYLASALEPTAGTLCAGTLDDVRGATIRQLREANKRLLMVIEASDVLSTYDDVANATLDGQSMLAAFERVLHAELQGNCSITVAQCQATATNLPEAVKYSVATADASDMLLMATKARCDHLLLPWLQQNVASRCRKDRLLVVMDDFLDGSVADVAVGLSKQRLA